MWSFEEKFNSDTKSTGDLNGQDGWTADVAFDVQNTTKYDGDQGIACVSVNGSEKLASYDIDDINAGKFYWAMMADGTDGRVSLELFANTTGTQLVGGVYFEIGGNIMCRKASGALNYGTYTANRWYIIEAEFDNVNQPNQIRYNIYDTVAETWGGTTGWLTTPDAYTNCVKVSLQVYSDTGQTFTGYYDTITPTDPTTSPVNNYTQSVLNALTLVDTKSLMERLRLVVLNSLSLAEVKRITQRFVKTISNAISLVHTKTIVSRFRKSVLNAISLVSTIITGRLYTQSILNSIPIYSIFSGRTKYRKSSSSTITIGGATQSTTSQGPNSPGTMADDATVGTVAWPNPDSAKASDDNTAGMVMSEGEISHYLKATNFGFSIPIGSTIDGILVEIEQSCALSNILESSIKIVKGGTISGDNKSTGATLPATDTYVEHGSSSDLWGETWSAEDINNSNFGVVFSVTKTGGGIDLVAIDHIRITVYYTIGSSGDTLGVIWRTYNNIVNSLSLVSVLSKIGNLRKTISDAISLSQSLVFGAQSYLVSVLNTLSLIDTKSITTRIRQSVLNALSVLDTKSTIVRLRQSISNTVSLFDTITTISHRFYLVTVSDIIGIIDRLTNVVSFRNTLNNILTLVDYKSVKSVFNKYIKDVVSLLDFKSALSSIKQSISDTLSVFDLNSIRLELRILTSSIISLVDTIGKRTRFNKLISDTLNTVDSLSVRLNFASLIISDTISLIDTAVKRVYFRKTIIQEILLNQILSSSNMVKQALSDTISLVETHAETLVHNFTQAISETISLVSNLTISAIVFGIHLVESIVFNSIVKIRGTWWTFITKHISTWTGQTKNTSTWTEGTKHSSIWDWRDKSDT